MPDYSWYYLGSTGALFFSWMPTAASNRPDIGEEISVTAFSSYKKYEENFVNDITFDGGV